MKSVMKLAILALIGAAASSASAHELRGHKVKVRRSIIAWSVFENVSSHPLALLLSILVVL